MCDSGSGSSGSSRTILCIAAHISGIATLGSVLTAIILVRATRPGLATLGPALAETEGVAEVYTVTGEWDFVAIIRVREQDELATIVTQELARLDGIERTHTMVAFQQFSRHDLEAMFGLGLET